MTNRTLALRRALAVLTLAGLGALHFGSLFLSGLLG
jgi:hypothetical protein